MILEQEAHGIPFLAKPFRLSELKRVIQTLIEREPTSADLDPAARNLP